MASREGRNRRNSAQSNLHQQDLTKLDSTKLLVLPAKVISRQATMNIGTTGHVAHEKSTVVKAITGLQIVRFKNELKRNIVIKLEPLSDTVIKVYQERADEKQENMLYEKIKRTKIRVTPESDDEIEPPSKKQKLSKDVKTFIIEKIIDFKYTNNKEHFYVKWQGYTDDDNTWEPIENLDNCPLILADYVSEEEIKHCQKIEKLKSEISFGDLLSEENLIKRLEEAEDSNLLKVKETLLLKMIAMITFDESEGNDMSELVQNARNILQLYVAARKRRRQLIELMRWEEQLNQVDKCKLVVENTVDFTGPPENFTYINKCLPGKNVKIPDDPPIGCECLACNCRAKTCCGMQAGLYAYTVNKRLRVAPGTPIYECNKACKCSSECSNRVVQNGRNIKLCIFRTSTGCGWGVRTEQKIRQGQFLCQYVGEVITFEEAENRGQEYDANGLTYLFDLDFNSAENLYTVDACQAGNVSHFINHSCDPNLGVWAAWGDCLDPNLPMLALFATRDIEAGEEVNFDYLQKNSDYDGPSASYSVSEEGCEPVGEPSLPNGFEPMTTTEVPASPTTSRLEIHQQNRNHRNYTECKCGSVKCRRFLF